MVTIKRTVASLLCAVSLSIVGGASVLAEVSNADLKRAIEAVDSLARKEIDARKAVGIAIAVVHDDKLVYAKGFGERAVGSGLKVDADTVFQLASVSKPVGATVVAALIGDGQISWDSKINELDPSFEMKDPWVTREVTLRDMYAHRSGLPDHAGDMLEDIGYNREQVLHRLRYQKPSSSFRSEYAYTNFGLTAAAVAAAKANGLTWENASAEKLYKPLGMQSTSSKFADFDARTNKALLHVFEDNKWVQKYTRYPDAQSPAGGVSSSVNDVAKWMRLRLANGKFEGKQIVAEKPLVETEHPVMLTGFNPINKMPGFYGLGMNVSYDDKGRLRLGHSGAFALGASTAFSLVPSEKLGIVVLTNSFPMGVPEGLTSTFVDVALDGKPSQDWMALFKKIFADPATLGLNKNFDYSKPPANAAPALANAAYVGAFENKLFGRIEIRDNAGALSIAMRPSLQAFPLKHYSRDVFTFVPAGENAAGSSGVTFTVGADGRASEVVVESLNENGQGVFKRVK